MTVSTNGTGTHALVIGGSMAGLWAGRVLTDHFDRVTIIDRDRYPDQPEFRNGVPQGHHIHILLARGLQILEQLFPQLVDELAAAGAPTFDLGEEMAYLVRTGWATNYHSGIFSLASSRILLESMIRQALAKYLAISLVQNAEVVDLLADESKTHVTGVRVRYRRGADDEGDEMFSADLIVDASGRGSKAPDWLEKLGYPPIEETIVDSFLSYSTRWYNRPASYSPAWKLMFINTAPPNLPRGGGIIEVEGGRWIATLGGAARDYPPTDEAGFMEFSQTLLTRAMYDALKEAEPISPIYGYQRTANRLRHFERLPRFPDNFVVMGDAVCGFNPIYGQGMSVAGMGALALDECLRQGRGDGLAQRFQRRLAQVNAAPWLLATGEDFRYPTTEGGQRTWMTRFSHWYTNHLLRVLPGDLDIEQAFSEVAHLLKPPTQLFQPAIMTKVMIKAFQLRGTTFPAQYELPQYWQQTIDERPI